MAGELLANSRAVQNREIEREYSTFGKSGRPITTVAIAFLMIFLVMSLIKEIQFRSHDPSLLEALYSWIDRQVDLLWFVLPAIIAGVRGRKSMRCIFYGKLSVGAILGVGVAAGCFTCYISSIVGDRYFTIPSIHPSGFISGLKDGFPLTAYLFGPFGEEMFFQVGLQTWLQKYGSFVAVIGSTAPFVASHLFGGHVSLAVGLIWLLPGMLTNALVRQITKSFGAAVISHSTYNILVSLLIFYPR